MHTKNDLDFPKSCELCDYELESNKELKQHMKIHSYKEVDYKCEDCDFCRTNCMEVYLGKAHSENFECGLCESEMEDLETLELHLFTCEVYKCCYCDERLKTLHDLKVHMSEDEDHKKQRMIRIIHAKISRENSEDKLGQSWAKLSTGLAESVD